MQIVKLYPILVISNLSFFLWFYVAYRFHQKEIANGDTSFPQIIWMLILPGGLLFYLWKRGWEAPLATWLDYFVTAQLSLGITVGLLYAIQKIFMTKGVPRKERALLTVYLLFFLGLFGTITFTLQP